jgi:hypothetical protein
MHSEWVRGYRTSALQSANILAEKMVGQFKVQVFPYPGDNEPVYRILIEQYEGCWRKVNCITDADERRFPKRAAAIGTRMVEKQKLLTPATLAPQTGTLSLFA